MAIGDGMGMEQMLPLTARSAGTYTSSPVTSPILIPEVGLWVYVSEISGSATLDCFVESSPDGSTWTPIVGSGTPTLTGVGSTSANAPIPANDGEHVRVTSTVGGTDDSTVTYRAVVLVGSN